MKKCFILVGLLSFVSTLLAPAVSSAQVTEFFKGISSSPGGIAVDDEGNVFVAGGDRALKITPKGVPTEIIDSTGDGAGNALASARGVALDGSGNVFVTGNLSNNAFKITPGGAVSKIIDAPSAWGVAVDGSGNAYVGSLPPGFVGDNVFKITPGGTVTAIMDTNGDNSGNFLSHPYAMAADASGNVFVAGLLTDNAFRVTSGGAITEIIDDTGDGSHPLTFPWGLALDKDGNVFVTGDQSNNAFKITPGGTITEIIDASGDGAGNTLDGPGGVAVDWKGNVFVAGGYSDNLFMITPTGTITEIIDASGDGWGHTLDDAAGVAVDGVGGVYVTGFNSGNILKFSAGQSIRGRLMLVKDPRPLDSSKRVVKITAMESATDDGLYGDPIASGAVVTVIANGATSTEQQVTIPPGAKQPGSHGWKQIKGGFKFINPGTPGSAGIPVRSFLMKKTSSGKLIFKLVMKGNLTGGIDVVPPKPGTDGGLIVEIGLFTYCVNFGAEAGGKVINSPPSATDPLQYGKVFKIASAASNPTTEIVRCPALAP